MSTTITEKKPIQFLAMILTLQFTLFFATFFNIPVARQVIGFLYLTLVLGSIIVKIH